MLKLLSKLREKYHSKVLVDKILTSIKFRAEEGESEYKYYYNLENSTLEKLTAMGFKISKKQVYEGSDRYIFIISGW